MLPTRKGRNRPSQLYSLPSRDIIADTVEYQCNAHCADALICIPNCDKVVPGMLMAALRLNIPTVFVSGGPMEAGTTTLADGTVKSTDLIDVMYATADDSVSDEELLNYEKTVCPTCGSCAGMFTANSMNCLTEAIGLALPGNGTILASHSYRKDLFKRAARQVVKIAHQYYDDSDDSVLPRSIATKEAFENAMTMDVAMGGSTNTVLHILAMAQSADVDFTLDDIERISHTVPCICKASPSGKWEISDVHRAGGITGILGELDDKAAIERGEEALHVHILGKLDTDLVADAHLKEALGAAAVAGCGDGQGVAGGGERFDSVKCGEKLLGIGTVVLAIGGGGDTDNAVRQALELGGDGAGCLAYGDSEADQGRRNV